MRRLTFFYLFCLVLGGILLAAPTQAYSASGPSAWVYVSSQIGDTSNTDVYGFTAASNGKLTLISTAPVATNLNMMAVNGLYLFGTTTGSLIDSYHIESNGRLSLSSTTDTSKQNNCPNASSVILDHTGQSLYNDDSVCSNPVYEQWRVSKSNGALTFLGATVGNEITALNTFAGNNEYAYGASCYHFDAQISGFKRNSNGSLTRLNLTQVMPSAPSNSGGYCFFLAAADPTNHLAIGTVLLSSDGSFAGVPYQLATYTVNSNGSISTKSTYANMPKVAVGNISALAMSPSGKLLAVAGSSGLQVFHFNGASPIIKYTGLISTSEIDQIFWDRDNHLYAIGTNANKLAVFTLTPTSWKYVETYTVHKPVGLIVQPLPLP